MTAYPWRPRRFLRSLRPSDGSAAADAAIAMDLDRQLDAWVTGTPAPASLTSSATDEHARLAGLTSAFQQVAAMDATSRERTESSTAHAKAIIWEDIMSATTAIPSSSRPSDTPEETTWARKRVERSLPPAARSQNSTLPRWPSRPALSPILNVAMVAIMLLTLGLGAFAIAGGSDRWGLGGNGNDPGPAGVNGLASLPAGLQGKPIAQVSLPTAAECRVTPLTVDQVMARIKATDSTSAGTAATVVTPNVATPPLLRNVPPTLKDIDEIAAVHREYIACVMKGDQLQTWSFYTPRSDFWKELRSRFPAFADEAMVRAKLKAVLEGRDGDPQLKTIGLAPNISGGQEFPLVNPDPTASLVIGDQETTQGRVAIIAVSMLYYNLSDPIAEPSYTPIKDYYQQWSYTWDEESQSWKLMTSGALIPG